MKCLTTPYQGAKSYNLRGAVVDIQTFHASLCQVEPSAKQLVTHGDRCLLGRQPKWPHPFFSALAGFVEPGESIEDCVRREVREEVGLEVAGITYFDSQPWAFPHSLMVAYTAEYAGGDIRVDDAEIAEARWFTPESLPSLPPSVSIARRLIDATAARLSREAGDDAC